MKHFKSISIAFIAVIAVIFCGNIFYLVKLYNSIKDNIEREVMTALADADLDELWVRAERANSGNNDSLGVSGEETEKSRHGETSVYKNFDEGNMHVTTTHPDGRVETQNYASTDGDSFTNKFIGAVGRQFHSIVDPYVPVDLRVLDSVVNCRLNDRFIYPKFVASEVVDSTGNAIVKNLQMFPKNLDIYSYCYNPAEGMCYRVHITPLTGQILSEMAGVIVTIFLLFVSFSFAFWFLLRTVSRLRSIEEMKDDFVSNVTHELKTPIAIAYSANDALLNFDSSNDPQRKERYLRIAYTQLKRLEELVESILAMSMERRKSMKIKPESINLSTFIEEIASAQEMRTLKEIHIILESDKEVSVVADKKHLTNILNNLIDNAIKYSYESVTITIKADDGGISIADNGIGIPPKSIPYLFNKFYRVPSGNIQNVRGYGIGLYYVKSMLDKMGWSISVNSKEGEGSIFLIKFGKKDG
ncbi:MAG: HAMP domain-containing histidine kinase [Muribaculaceae bacterium]|nr:HAMP domain-containing histidine kinase [Muribaculaceae bacterium]